MCILTFFHNFEDIRVNRLNIMYIIIFHKMSVINDRNHIKHIKLFAIFIKKLMIISKY